MSTPHTVQLPSIFARARLGTSSLQKKKQDTPPPPPPSPPPSIVAAANPSLKKKAKKAVSTEKQRKNAQITPEAAAKISLLPVNLVDALSTYDKGARSTAPQEERMAVTVARLKRAREKNQPTPTAVDNNLINDQVGTMAAAYEKHAQYAGSTRVLKNIGEKRTRPDKDDDDEGEEDEKEENDDDDDGGGEIHLDDETRMLIVPKFVKPDTEAAYHVSTFEEYATPDPAKRQFEHNNLHIRGREQTVFVEISDEATRYKHVTDTLETSLCVQQFVGFAIQNNLRLPKLPCVTKAEIQASLSAPNYQAGERACAFGHQCASYRMSAKCIQRDTGGVYAGLEPFPCKEFYFGALGDKVREGIANGISPEQLYDSPPVMCVLCHLEQVLLKYKVYDMDLETSRVRHILHSFHIIVNVPGEYPETAKLDMQGKFKGVIAPFLRFCEDNYIWVPTVAQVSAGKTLVLPKPIQRWREHEWMDFH